MATSIYSVGHCRYIYTVHTSQTRLGYNRMYVEVEVNSSAPYSYFKIEPTLNYEPTTHNLDMLGCISTSYVIQFGAHPN